MTLCPPYLFILCAEGLSRLLNQTEDRGELRGISLKRGGPTVNHLFFAEDSFLFCLANTQSAIKISDMLRTYELCSGQRVNFEKSAIFFSKNTTAEEKDNIIAELGQIHRDNLGLYIGLPAVVGRLKKKMLEFIKEWVKTKIKGWKNNFLSPAGKEVMLKLVLSAIPSYALSCFQFSDCLGKEITTIFSDFWSGQNEGKRKMHYEKWQKLCEAKCKGGLGFRDEVI